MTTNLERIRQMTADELAELLDSDCSLYCAFTQNECFKGYGDCKQGIRNWLGQESEE